MAEREKRRATTFRTSKGTIVNVAAPTVYVSPAFLSTEDVTSPAELREELVSLQGNIIMGSEYSEKTKLVKAWSSDPTVETSESILETLEQSAATYFGAVMYRLDAAATHTKEIYTPPVKPQSIGLWGLVLPTITPTLGPMNFGVEGSLITDFPWIAYFRLHSNGNFYIHLGTPAGLQTVAITGSLPANYDSAYHSYWIWIYPNKAEFYIDKVLIATLYSPDFPLVSDTSAWIMINQGTGSTYIRSMRLLGGLDKHTEGYFYSGATNWNAYAYTGGTNSEAAPCKGYEIKTINFVTNTVGTLTIQVQEPDGGWQTYHTIVVGAGDLNAVVPYHIEGRQRAVRISFSVNATITAWWEFL